MANAKADERERVRAAIEALPEEVRRAYRLHLFDELDYPQIALCLAIDTLEVENRIAEAIVLIDRALRADESGEVP